jgi:hypothetical protein
MAPIQKNGPDFGASLRFLLVALLVVLIVVAPALPTRDRAAVAAVDRRGHHTAVSLWANGHAARADADSGVRITAVAVAIIAIPPELNIDLSHLKVLGLGRDAADK